MKKIICSILLITSASAIAMTKKIADHAPFDDTKEFTPQILTRFEVPQPLLEALKNHKNKNALRYLGLRLYNRRVAPLNNKGEDGDYLDFETLRILRVKVTNNPTEATIQSLAHWLSRKPIPTGQEALKKVAKSDCIGVDFCSTIHSTIYHSDTLGDFCEIICKHINHIAQNEDWTPTKTENVMVNFLKIYLNLTNSSSSAGTTTKGK